jgi:hypothetical protein
LSHSTLLGQAGLGIKTTAGIPWRQMHRCHRRWH